MVDKKSTKVAKEIEKLDDVLQINKLMNLRKSTLSLKETRALRRKGKDY